MRADIINALGDWEPRIRVNQVVLTSVTAGGMVTFDLFLTYLPNGEPVALRGVTI